MAAKNQSMETTKTSRRKAGSTPAREKLIEAYINFVLTEGKKPASVYKFCLDQGIKEDEFYAFFGSFEGLEKSVWKEMIDRTIRRVEKDPSFISFAAVEKVLAFYYTLLEEFTSNRSFIVSQLNQPPKLEITPGYIRDFKKTYEEFIDRILKEALNKGEIARRPYIESRYPDMFWTHFVTLLFFWRDDDSPSFEKTDMYVEKSVKLAFELVGKGVLDTAFDFAKFLYQTRVK